MPYIVIDTETTGLFQYKNEDGSTKASDAPGQPRMCEFAAVMCDDAFNVTETYQAYIQPVGWDHDMSPDAQAVHGLSMDFLREQGKPVTMALAVYTNAIKEGRVLVGFNQQHDGRMMRAELRHAGLPDMFEDTPNICAMRSITTNLKGLVKKLNGKGGFPRLIDACAHFGIEYDESVRHHALDDAIATAKVARCLHEISALLPAAVHYAKDSPKGEAA